MEWSINFVLHHSHQIRHERNLHVLFTYR